MEDAARSGNDHPAGSFPFLEAASCEWFFRQGLFPLLLASHRRLKLNETGMIVRGPPGFI